MVDSARMIGYFDRGSIGENNMNATMRRCDLVVRVTVAGVIGVGTAAGGAGAQPVEAMEYSIAWDKPVLAPGEVQTGHVWLTVTPEIGSAVQWNTAPGKGQDATLMAIASAFMKVINIENGMTGQITNFQVVTQWSPGQSFAQLDGNGGIKDINAGQFGPPANPNPNTGQSAAVFWFKWDPMGDYTPRTVTYQALGTAAKVYLSVPGFASWVGENAEKISMQSSFQVVPAPGGIVMAVGIVRLLARRTRRPA
jgi:hypothetical protein